MTRRLLSLFLLLALCPAVLAKDVWRTPFPGVRYLHRTTQGPRWDIHVAVVDLSNPGVRLTATAPKDRRTTVSAFAKREGVQVAVNAGFFSYETYATSGLAVGEDKVWTDTKDETTSGQLAASGAKALIIEPKEVVQREAWMRDVVSGHPLLVREGAVLPHKGDLSTRRHPRTAVGLSRDRKTLYLLVVDGRQSHSVGMTAAEEAKALRDLGAWTALNLDGGGSSAMFIQGLGVVNRPSDGRERVVANHLGVSAKRASASSSAASPTPSPSPAPSPAPSPTASSSTSRPATGAPSSTAKPSPTAKPPSSASSAPGRGGSSPVLGPGTSDGPNTSAAGSRPAGASASESLSAYRDIVSKVKKNAAEAVKGAVLYRDLRAYGVQSIEVWMIEAAGLFKSADAGKLAQLKRGPAAPVRGKVRRKFGPTDFDLLPSRQHEGRVYDHFNDGLDFAAAPGAPVRSLDAGLVTRIGIDRFFGNTVVVAHPGGLVSAYANLAGGKLSPTVKPGQYVDAGDVLGRAGTSGMNEGAGLHLMTRKDALVDPAKFLPK